jgi:hypothetical protein
MSRPDLVAESGPDSLGYGVTSENTPPFTEMPLPFPVAAKPVAVGARPSKARRYKGLPA